MGSVATLMQSMKGIQQKLDKMMSGAGQPQQQQNNGIAGADKGGSGGAKYGLDRPRPGGKK